MPGMEMGIEGPGLMAVHAPYATVLWDFINRGMPLNKEGSLTPDEVYSITAFLLWKGEVIKEDEGQKIVRQHTPLGVVAASDCLQVVPD